MLFFFWLWLKVYIRHNIRRVPFCYPWVIYITIFLSMVILHILLILFHHRDTIREVLLIFLNLFVAQTIIYYVKHKTHVYLTIYLYTCTTSYTVISPDKHTYCTVREITMCGVWYTYTLYDKMPVLKLCRFRFYVVLSLWIFISKLPIKYHYFMGNSNRVYNTYYQRQNLALIPNPTAFGRAQYCNAITRST